MARDRTREEARARRFGERERERKRSKMEKGNEGTWLNEVAREG